MKQKRPIVWTTDEIRAVHEKDITRAGLELAKELFDRLYGNHPLVSAIALADAVSMWIACHVGLDAAGREQKLQELVQLIRQLLPDNIKSARALKRHLLSKR